jgi:hypothetical protein
MSPSARIDEAAVKPMRRAASWLELLEPFAASDA